MALQRVDGDLGGVLPVGLRGASGRLQAIGSHGVRNVQCLSVAALKPAFLPSGPPTTSTRVTSGVLPKCRVPGTSSDIASQNLWGWNPGVLIKHLKYHRDNSVNKDCGLTLG